MNKEELIRIYSAYLPYELTITDVTNNQEFILEPENISGVLNDAEHLNTLKPHLYDLSYLTKEIEHEGRKIVPVEYFEITDDSDSYPIEHDHGNFKLIKDLESIAKNNSYHDIQFLPFETVQRLISFHINVFGLKEDQFINKATLNK